MQFLLFLLLFVYLNEYASNEGNNSTTFKIKMKQEHLHHPHRKTINIHMKITTYGNNIFDFYPKTFLNIPKSNFNIEKHFRNYSLSFIITSFFL